MLLDHRSLEVIVISDHLFRSLYRTNSVYQSLIYLLNQKNKTSIALTVTFLQTCKFRYLFLHLLTFVAFDLKLVLIINFLLFMFFVSEGS